MKWKGILLFVFVAAIIAVPLVYANQTDTTADKGKTTHEEVITEEEAAKLTAEWVAKKVYVLAGGSYQEGEYTSFMYEDMYYRYFASEFDSKEKLMAYLTETITVDYAEKFFEEYHFIVHEGKLAQPEADGGSLLQWNKAKATLLEANGDEYVFAIEVPVAELNEIDKHEVTIKLVDGQDFRVSNLVDVAE